MNKAKAFTLIALGLAIGTMGVYVADVDDAPGAAVVGGLVMLSAIGLGVRTARNRLPRWAGRTALAGVVLVAGFTALLTRGVAAAVPLFAADVNVPSASNQAPSPHWAAAVDRARLVVRAAIVAQNLPGVSIAVGSGRDIIWAEGFGWRDVETETPVTPDTRFNIGTAASAITTAAIASLGMSNTGADSATEWSPGHIGEPEEDFPGFTFFHKVILRPMGLAAAAQPLPGDRATFYVPATRWRNDTTDPREGRRLMYMRDLACCADGKAFYSTPSDLVRFALATNAGTLNGELAGGSVLSLLRRSDNGTVVAVASNVSHAKTAALASSVAEVLTPQ